MNTIDNTDVISYLVCTAVNTRDVTAGINDLVCTAVNTRDNTAGINSLVCTALKQLTLLTMLLALKKKKNQICCWT